MDREEVGWRGAARLERKRPARARRTVKSSTRLHQAEPGRASGRPAVEGGYESGTRILLLLRLC